MSGRAWQLALLVEGAAAFIALAMTFGPRRAGVGDGPGIPEMLLDQPGPGLQWLTWFVLTNLLMLVMALVLWLWVRSGRRNS